MMDPDIDQAGDANRAHGIDRALENAARLSNSVPASVLDRIDASIQSSLQPVRPAPSTPVLTAGMLLLCAAVALAGAAHSGFFGFQALTITARVVIFSILALLAGVASRELVSHWIPGSRHYLTPRWLVALASATLLFAFAPLFHDYHATHFISAGLVCLTVGVLHAAPAAGLAAWFLRRGFAVEPVAAGVIAGTFGGLSGVTMLELHCANLEAPHVLLWHVAVVPVSAALGALAGWAIRAWVGHGRP
jgi:hypothetical protein